MAFYLGPYSVNLFLVICAAGYQWSANTIGSLFQKHVCSTFSMKMVLNCVHIWSIDLFLVKDKAPVRNLIKSLFKECSNLCSIFHLSGNVDANHARPMGLFFHPFEPKFTVFSLVMQKGPTHKIIKKVCSFQPSQKCQNTMEHAPWQVELPCTKW